MASRRQQSKAAKEEQDCVPLVVVPHHEASSRTSVGAVEGAKWCTPELHSLNPNAFESFDAEKVRNRQIEAAKRITMVQMDMLRGKFIGGGIPNSNNTGFRQQTHPSHPDLMICKWGRYEGVTPAAVDETTTLSGPQQYCAFIVIIYLAIVIVAAIMATLLWILFYLVGFYVGSFLVVATPLYLCYLTQRELTKTTGKTGFGSPLMNARKVSELINGPNNAASTNYSSALSSSSGDLAV